MIDDFSVSINAMGGSCLMMDDLNEEQLHAVKIVDGAVLILAGAGTGKTKTLTSRIAYIIANGFAKSYEILAVTFTNKAAKEMIHRIRNIAGEIEIPWVGTFHSIAAKILRVHAEKIGFKRDFVIIDVDDQLKLLKNICVDLAIEHDKNVVSKILSIIQSWKDKLLSPDKVQIRNFGKNAMVYSHAARCYEYYQEKLKLIGCMDFGDLLLHNISLFNHFPDVLDQYQSRFKYIMVDEYQDTNSIQYLWLKLLSAQNKNLCCVGDDDQSIYGWRGAELKNILNFSEDFSGAVIIKLERNYRSTSQILNAAHSIISCNNNRLAKRLWTDNDDGSKVNLMLFSSSYDESNFIISYIIKHKLQLNNTAILVRAGFQTRAFEDSCINHGLNYHIVGGMKFYERKEVRDIIAYLRVIINGSDDLAFERVVNVPKRGVGAASIKKIYSCASTNSVSLLEASKMLLSSDELKCNSLQKFVNDIESWSHDVYSLTPLEFVKKVIEESGYTSMLEEDDEVSRIENLRELCGVINDFESVTEFLQHASLITDNDMLKDSSSPALNIMTIHAAKGLEFDNVFLPGWEDGIFPHKRSFTEESGIEEERRLAYVAITRAKKFLLISYAQKRLINSTWEYNAKSRFLNELRDEDINVVSPRYQY